MKRLVVALGCIVSTADPATSQVVSIAESAEPTWGRTEVIEELRIGNVDGDPAYSFDLISDLAVAHDGTIIVVEGRVPAVRMYDANGRFIRDIGRHGDGPGEYRQPWGAGVLPDGRIAVWDPPRLHVYGPDGTSISSHLLRAGMFGTDPFKTDMEGNFYFVASDWKRGGRTPSPGATPKQWLKFNDSLELVDSMPVPIPYSTDRGFTLVTAQGRVQPFTPVVSSDLGPNGELVIGDNSEYVLLVQNASGETTTIRRDVPTVTLTRGERAEWEELAEYFANRGADADVSIPRTKPPFREISVDDDGRIWVDRYVEAEQRPGLSPETGDSRPDRRWIEPRTFDVLSAQGELLGIVVMPSDAYGYVRRGDHIWGVARDELGVQYVVRLRIARTD